MDFICNNYRIFNSSDIDFNVFFILLFCLIICSLLILNFHRKSDKSPSQVYSVSEELHRSTHNNLVASSLGHVPSPVTSQSSPTYMYTVHKNLRSFSISIKWIVVTNIYINIFISSESGHDPLRMRLRVTPDFSKDEKTNNNCESRWKIHEPLAVCYYYIPFSRNTV